MWRFVCSFNIIQAGKWKASSKQETAGSLFQLYGNKTTYESYSYDCNGFKAA